ncbi:hypothetical protein WJX74_008099 [Apatococcus lobatus]|uniref:Uncharacterized protein n=1 Tax=Apatococcus lobatus TaxID=904363 RepID=A0AAW1R0B1_9CHLO
MLKVQARLHISTSGLPSAPPSDLLLALLSRSRRGMQMWLGSNTVAQELQPWNDDRLTRGWNAADSSPAQANLDRCQVYTMDPVWKPRSSPAPLLPLTKGNQRFYTGFGSQQRSGPSPGRYGSPVHPAPSHLPRPGSTCYVEEGPRASQASVTAAGEEAVFLLEGDDGRPQRVGRELSPRAVRKYTQGVHLPAQDEVWSRYSEGPGIMYGLAEEEEEEPVEGGAAVFARAWSVQRALDGMHGQVPCTQEPQRVVVGFHVCRDAAVDGEEVGAGMGSGQGTIDAHVHDLFDVHEFQGEQLQQLSAYVDDIVQDGRGAPGPVMGDVDAWDVQGADMMPVLPDDLDVEQVWAAEENVGSCQVAGLCVSDVAEAVDEGMLQETGHSDIDGDASSSDAEQDGALQYDACRGSCRIPPLDAVVIDNLKAKAAIVISATPLVERLLKEAKADFDRVASGHQVKTNDQLAVIYNDAMPLEEHHAAAALGLGIPILIAALLRDGCQPRRQHYERPCLRRSSAAGRHGISVQPSACVR